MTKYYPEGNRKDGGTVSGYILAQTLETVLRAAGDDVSRENIMRKAASLKDVKLGMLLPRHDAQHSVRRLLSDKTGARRALQRNGVEPVGDLITARSTK